MKDQLHIGKLKLIAQIEKQLEVIRKTTKGNSLELSSTEFDYQTTLWNMLSNLKKNF